MVNKAKIFVINAKTEFELVKKLNDCDKPVFATQIMQKTDGSWTAFIYY